MTRKLCKLTDIELKKNTEEEGNTLHLWKLNVLKQQKITMKNYSIFNNRSIERTKTKVHATKTSTHFRLFKGRVRKDFINSLYFPKKST